MLRIDESGQGVIESLLVVVLIAVIAYILIITIGTRVGVIFSRVASALR